MIALNATDFAVKKDAWLGQYMTVSLPSSAASWTATRVRFRVRTHGGTPGLTRVQIRNAAAGLPTTVLDEASLAENTLTSAYAWTQVAFGKQMDLAPVAGVCVVFQWKSDTDACDVQYQSVAGFGFASNLVTTANGGKTWTAYLAQDLLFELYGTYTTADAQQYRTLVTGVRLTVAAGDAKAPTLRAAVLTVNQPEVTQ